jgi:RNA polymerase-binding transcription factor DksA
VEATPDAAGTVSRTGTTHAQQSEGNVTKRELEGHKQHLLSLGHRIKGDMSHLAGEALRKTGGEAAGSLSNMPLHLADLGTDAFDRDLTMNLLENETRTLHEIAAALGRIEAGTFGVCEQCGGAIVAERLQALPYVRCCIECARAQDTLGAAGFRNSGL